MQHLLKAWQALSANIRAAPHLLLLSDYDGTLTPIVGRPQDAVLSAGVRDKLSALARKPDFSVGIISGRSMGEIKSMTAIEGIYFAGNHGLEIEGPGLKYVSPQAELTRATIKDLAGQLAAALENIAGVIIEDKGLSLSVHYRMVREGEEGRVTEVFHEITGPPVREGKIRTSSGKKVLEVRPPIDWHKGKAVEAIREQIRQVLGGEEGLVIYLGDDTTDEDVFRMLHRPEGWGIYIGRENSESKAGYYLSSTEEVGTFLTRLLELR